MSDPSSGTLPRKPSEPVETTKARLIIELGGLATDIAAITADINILTERVASVVEKERSIPTRLESELKPRMERRADARIRNELSKVRFDACFDQHVAEEGRKVLVKRAAELARELVGMGTSDEELRATGWDGALE